MAKLIITSGDPAGIGSEVTLKTLAEFDPGENVIVILGDLALYQQVSGKVGVDFSPAIIEVPEKAKAGVNFLQVSPENFGLDILGKPDERSARAAFNYLQRSVELLNSGFDAVVTAPISKEKLWKIGFRYPGHTEFYAEKLGAERFVMMLAGDKLRITLVTIHVPLRVVPDLVTE